MTNVEGPAPTRREHAHRLASELRRMIERLVLADAPAAQLVVAADRIRAFADWLAELPVRHWYEGFAEAANAGSPNAVFDQSPLIGLSNPLAPPILIEVVPEGEGGTPQVHGSVTFGAAYEGPPGCVHGGMLAAAFDEVLGVAQSLTGRPGMTGTLTVRYRKPTPLHAALTFVGKVDRVAGRKIFVAGTCKSGDKLTAEAEAVFISVNFGKIAQMIEDRESSGSPRPP